MTDITSPLIQEGERSSGYTSDQDQVLDQVLDLAEDMSPTSRKLYWNFWLMAISFSVNHGCVVSCLAYSTAELGTDMGGYGSGVLYVFYALTALFLSKPVVAGLGASRPRVRPRDADAPRVTSHTRRPGPRPRTPRSRLRRRTRRLRRRRARTRR